MPASEARKLANQANAALSTGPRTPEGKERSRANSYKHGLTGAGVVMSEREAAEVERRVKAFEAELNPSGEVGIALTRRAATLSVRMERCVEHENVLLTERVRQAEADFVPPEGVDDAEAARLRSHAGKLAMFDPSPEATLARKYEASAERGFYRALKELRQMEKAAKEAEAEINEQISQQALASFSRMEELDAEFDALYPEEAPMPPSKARNRFEPAAFPTIGGGVDVPFAIGRPR